ARGGAAGTPPEPSPQPQGKKKRARPERALLSLDVQFLKSDNVVRLDSLAPTGAVKLSVARREVFTVRFYLGAVLGMAAAILLLLAPRISLLRILPAAALFIVALHFAGLSFLSGDFARGAGWALVATMLLAVISRIPRMLRWVWSLIRRIRWPRRPAAGAAALLVAASLAHAGEGDGTKMEETLVPYKGDKFDAIEQVFLPSERYHKLRRLAYPDKTERQTVVSSARYEAARTGDDVTVTAHYAIVKETAAAERIALRLQGIAVTEAKLNDKPATLAVDKKRGYTLMLSGKGEFALTLTLRPRLDKKSGTQWIALPIRPVSTATLKLTDDSKGYEVNVAALGGEAAGTERLGPVSTLRVTWTPKTKGFTAQAAELRAHTALACSVRDGFTAIGAFVRFGISGGSVTRLRVMVDKTLTVRQVGTKYLAGWERDESGIVTIALSRPHTREALVGIVAERKTARTRTESVPTVQPLDVLRDAGNIRLETLADLKIELLKTQGLMRGKAPNKKPSWRGTPEWGTVHSVHRYAVRPFELEWRVVVEKTRFRARSETWLTLHKEQIAADVRMEVVVERGPGLFELQTGVPPEYEVLNAAGPNVRDWWIEDGRLHIALLRRHRGRATYAIQLRQRVATSKGVAAPALALLGAVRQPGLVRLLAADGLEIETGESEGLLPVNLDQLGKKRTAGFRAVRAYRHVAVPWSLTLSTREERREVEAFAVTRVVPLADRVRVEALLNFHVRRGLVDEVAFTVPVAEEKDIVLVAPEKREAKSVAIDGGRRYTLSLRNATRGSVAVTVTYHVAPGSPVRGVEPQGVSQLRRYVVVEKIADGEVKIPRHDALETTGFEELPIIPPGTSAENLAASYVGTGDPFVLDIAVRTHSFEEVARALIYSASAQIVVDRSGWTRTLVSYRVYNRSRQFLVLRLPSGAQLYSVLVAGQGVRPLTEGGKVLVPLRKVAIGSTTFDVDVVYAYGADALDAEELKARLPVVEGVDVRRNTVSLYLPRGYRYSFDTEMDRVDASSITVGQAQDLYEEIKELYGVAERGNRLQAQRALSNVAALEREAKRVAEQVEAQSDDQAQIKQIESQNRALDSLRRSRGQLEQRFGQVAGKPKPQANASYDTTTIFGALADARGQTVESWKVNQRYLDRNKMEDNDDLEEFRKANFRGRGMNIQDTYRGPNSGVPPGTREPSDKAPPGDPGASQEATIYVGDTPVLGKALGYGKDATATVSGGLAFHIDGKDIPPAAANAALFFTSKADEGDVRARPETRFAWAGADSGAGAGKSDVRITLSKTILASTVTDTSIQVDYLTRATGRISLRIDLPKDGEVFHFASAGDRATIAIDASESGGNWWKGLLAIVFLGIGAIVLRVGR
ncbi:MAG: hypothetical protein ACYTGZ_22450, partial [Planctomycetota bacterium]